MQMKLRKTVVTFHGFVCLSVSITTRQLGRGFHAIQDQQKLLLFFQKLSTHAGFKSTLVTTVGVSGDKTTTV